MTRAEVDVVIERPLEQVFAFISDPSRWPEWTSGLLEGHASETPIRKGTQLTAVMKFLGRRIDTRIEITEYELNKRVASRTTSPVYMEHSYTFETTKGGTRVHFLAEGESSGLFKLAEPVISRMYQRQSEGDFQTAKEILEAHVPGEGRVTCLLYTSPSPRDLSTARMPSSA